MKVDSQDIPTIITLDREIKTMIKYGSNYYSIMFPPNRYEHNLIYLTWAQNHSNISSSSFQHYWLMIDYWSASHKTIWNKMKRKEKKKNFIKKKIISSIAVLVKAVLDQHFCCQFTGQRVYWLTASLILFFCFHESCGSFH